MYGVTMDGMSEADSLIMNNDVSLAAFSSPGKQLKMTLSPDHR